MTIQEKILHGFILACLLVAGFSNGFRLPIVVAMICLGGLHYRRDFLPVRQRVEESQVNSLRDSVVALGGEISTLKSKVSGLAISSGFKPKVGARE